VQARAVALVIVLAGCGQQHMDVDAATAVAALDVSGSWYDCSTTLVLAPGGAASYSDLRRGCTADGHFTVQGRELAVTWTSSDCTHQPAWHDEVVRTAHTLVIVDLATGMSLPLVDGTVPRASYRLDETDGTTTHSTTLRVIGTQASGILGACYWSTDHGCGGLMSCGGGIAEWLTDDSRLHGAAFCAGSCPCGAQLDATPTTGGGFAGTYTGANCDHTFSGHFTATPIADP
jgi:hypothetical protein